MISNTVGTFLQKIFHFRRTNNTVLFNIIYKTQLLVRIAFLLHLNKCTSQKVVSLMHVRHICGIIIRIYT